MSEIVGLGVGLVSVPRLRRVLDRFGPHLEERIFLRAELEYAARKRNRWHNLGARFAAKCAGRRALSGLLETPVRLREIEVARKRTGEPTLRLHTQAPAARELRFALSLTHDPDFAAASVWVERGPAPNELD